MAKQIDLTFSNQVLYNHKLPDTWLGCVKSVRIWGVFGPYFSKFESNKKICRVNFHIQSNRNRKQRILGKI